MQMLLQRILSCGPTGTRPEIPTVLPTGWLLRSTASVGGGLGLHAYHTEDGVDNSIDGDGGGFSPVSHWPDTLPVISQEVVRQPLQSGPGGVVSLGCPLPPD